MNVRLRKMKVLVAEDSITSQMLIRAYIEEAGHQVITVENGQQAVDVFREERPDLVLLDVTMPIKDGIEAAKDIRKLTDNEKDWVPIIFLSAMSKPGAIARAIDAGGDDYLVKPIEALVLNAKLRAMQRIAKMRQQLHKANSELKMIAVKDGLTGLSNRRHFDETMERELKRAIRIGSSLSLVLCDIDLFKNYNDNYGHQGGDDCLKCVAEAMIKATNRPGDLVARYGGEEFGFILPATDLEGAQVIAESIRKTIDVLDIEHAYSSVADHVTLSCGVATIHPQKDYNIADLARLLIESADQGLYRAKQNGRNQVAVSE
jgi:diguanylate cyclase (GGDEF)-like protein